MLPSIFYLLAAVATVGGAPTGLDLSARADSDIVPGKYIVILKPGADASKVDAHLSKVRDIHARNMARRGDSSAGVDKVWKDTSSFAGYSGQFDKDTIKAINSKDEVASVEPVRKVTIFKTVTQSSATWGLASISHKAKTTSTDYVYDDTAGSKMWAYVVDTGIYTAHSDFGGRAFWGYNAYPNSKNVDNNGHGTHCAGTIVGTTYGVAKKANVMAVKVLDGSSSTTDIVLDGFQWAVTNITKTPGRAANSVISMSLGGTKSTAFNSAVDAASKAGILVVAAAGNNGYDASQSSPGSAASAITVGAIDNTNTRASFSNFGATVDVFAPGVGVTSLATSGPTAIATMSGTSMACPHVAGLALYLKAKEGNLSQVTAITNRIKALAVKNKVLSPGTGSPNLLAYNNAA